MKKPIVLTAAIGSLAAAAAVLVPLARADKQNHYAFYDPIIDVYTLIQQHFFKEPDLDVLQAGAIDGMIEALDDPYTEFIPAQAEEDFDKYIRGNYVGIGASVSSQDNFLLIISPLDDSPAYRAGVEADDLVVAVDGESVFGKPVDDIINLLTGKPGTRVTITIEREGTEVDIPKGAKAPSVPGEVGEAPGPKPGHVRFDLEIVRERIITSTVKGIHRNGDQWQYMIDSERQIAYIRVSQFTEGTVPELAVICERLMKDGLKGLILDLRFNSGGSLAAAIGMADLFLSDGMIVSQRGRTTREERAYAQSEGTLPDMPMLVMVNGLSASASEIVAGALSDNERAVILGERTYGKGLVQSVYRLPSGVGQLKITEQYYYLPSGRCIQRDDNSEVWGVDPTDGFYVPMTTKENTDMLRRRREEEVIRALKVEECCWDDPAWVMEELKDPQLSASIKALQMRIDGSEWVPTGQPAPKEVLSAAELRRQEDLRDRILLQLEVIERRIEALSLSAAPLPKPEPYLPEGANLTNGTLTVQDADGKTIARLKITGTGSNLNDWLDVAPVEKLPKDDGEEKRQ